MSKSGFLAGVALTLIPLMLGACTSAEFAQFLDNGPADKEAEKHRLDQRASEEMRASARTIALRDEQSCVRTGITAGYVIACASHGAARDAEN